MEKPPSSRAGVPPVMLHHVPDFAMSAYSQVSASTTASSAYVEVSPLSQYSSRPARASIGSIAGGGVSNAGRSLTRNLRRVSSQAEVEVPLISFQSTQQTTSPDSHSGERRAASRSPVMGATRASALLFVCPDTGQTQTVRLHSPTALSLSTTSDLVFSPSSRGSGSGVLDFRARRASHHESDPLEASYEPPKFLSLEHVLYAIVSAGAILRSFYLSSTFFTANIGRLRSGVGMPDPRLAALFPTLFVGYDGGLDRQWLNYVRSFPRLVLLAVGLAAVTLIIRHVHSPSRAAAAAAAPSAAAPTAPSTTARAPLANPRLAPTARAQQLLPTFYAIVGVVFVAIVHGPHFFLPLLIIAANYVVFTRLQRWCPYWLFMAIMWTTHVALLYIIEINEGFEKFYWMQYIAATDERVAADILGAPTQPLWGTNMRWYVAYRMTTLRLIAFNYDLWEATHAAARARERAAERHDTACVECAQLRERNNAAAAAAALPAEASRCYKYRTEYTRDLADYSFVNYVAYMLFPPLYIAGPMSSFNAFVSHMRVPSTAMPLRAMARYAARTLGLFLATYVFLHVSFVIAISERTDVLVTASLETQAYILYHYLMYLWLKFSFIWKVSRLFAMLSGIEVPEDMRRCFSNVATVRDFWRDWHASFNLWIVRYMYIPMGGRGRVALSVLPIFLFIAMWHDPALHLIKWALCIAVMFVAEMAVSACFGRAVAVFRREAATGTAGSGARAQVTLPSRGTSASVLPSSISGCAARAVASAARYSARYLSRGTRTFLHRQLCSAGCFFSVFGLIVANIVGFCVQNAKAEVKDTSTTDSFVVQSLSKANWWFFSGLFGILYSVACVGSFTRAWEAAEARTLRHRYGLRDA